MVGQKATMAIPMLWSHSLAREEVSLASVYSPAYQLPLESPWGWLYLGCEDGSEAARGALLAPCLQMTAFLGVLSSLKSVSGCIQTKRIQKTVDSAVVLRDLNFVLVSRPATILTFLTGFAALFPSFYSSISKRIIFFSTPLQPEWELSHLS